MKRMPLANALVILAVGMAACSSPKSEPASTEASAPPLSAEARAEAFAETVAGVALVAPADVEPQQVGRVTRSLLVVVGTENSGLPQAAALASAVAGAGGVIEMVEDAGPTFHRSLPTVGRTVAGWLQRLSGR